MAINNDWAAIEAAPRVTRLAPSPTGALHLGNAFAFALTWAIARQRGWRVVLRIDDLDGPRIKPTAAQGAIETLRWMGIDWDDGPHYESSWLPEYRDRLQLLAHKGWIYPCRCTRAQVQAAALSAPHNDTHELTYPGTCRPQQLTSIDFYDPQFDGAAWRCRAPQEPVACADQLFGPQSIDVAGQVGDFLVATKDRQATYQLAVVVDDHLQHVTDVIRGVDLLPSTGRQIALHNLLGFETPTYWHTPLIVGPDGLRLAKRHGDTRVESYAHSGVSANQIIGLLAYWAGAMAERCPCTLEELRDSLRLDRLPRASIVCGPADHQWLLEGARR